MFGLVYYVYVSRIHTDRTKQDCKGSLQLRKQRGKGTLTACGKSSPPCLVALEH